MNTKIITAITAIFLVTIVSAKPLVKSDSNLSNQFNQFTSKLHKLIKRAAVGTESSPKTGFAAITSTDGVKNHKKTRKCEEWEKEPITKQWKCIKFIVVDVAQKN